MTQERFSRRGALALISMAAMAAAIAPASAAISQAAARKFVEDTIDELFRIQRSGGGVAAQRRAFLKLLNKRAAIDAIARTCLGVTWRSTPKNLQRAYIDAFKTYVSNKYGSRFDEFTQIEITIGRITDYGRRGVVVQTFAKLKNGKTAEVDWGLSDRGGRVQITNIVVEGVSLVTSERELIAQILERNRGDVGKLVAELKTLR